jgi:NADPH-ferrihemoprotein reductase
MPGAKLGPAILFFGCRKSEHDYIYKEELESYLLSGALTELHVAFSRDGPSKEYVQHHLEKRAHDVGKLLTDEQVPNPVLNASP